MLITIKRGNLVLANGDWAVGVVTRGLPFPTKREMEVIAMIDAVGVSVFDRTTRTVELEFTITREHEGAAQALVFAATHDGVATGKADLRIQFTQNDVTYTLKSLGCAWQAVTSEPYGLSTDSTYRVSGPPFVATDTEGGAVGEFVEGGDGYDQNYGPIIGVLDGGCYGDNGIPGELTVHSPEY